MDKLETEKYIKIIILYEDDHQMVLLNATTLSREEIDSILQLNETCPDDAGNSEFVFDIGLGYNEEATSEPKYIDLITGHIYRSEDMYEQKEGETKQQFEERRKREREEDKAEKERAQVLNKQLNQGPGYYSIVLYGWC